MVLPPTKKAPSSSRVKGPPSVAACDGTKAAASIAIPRLKFVCGFMVAPFERSCEYSRPQTDPFPRHLRKRGNSKERHVALDLVAQEPDAVAHAGFRADRGRVEEGPADEYELRAERERLQDIGAAADAAVHHHGHAARLRDHRGERAKRRSGAVQLPPAVVRHDDPVDAALAGDTRIFSS